MAKEYCACCGVVMYDDCRQALNEGHTVFGE